MTRSLLSALAALSASLAACGGSHQGSGSVRTAPTPASTSTSAPVTSAAAIARAQADSARYPYIGADVHFMSGMIGHHAQAIKMAGWAQSHGAGPAVLTLAGRIINAQQDEIAAMQRWLVDRRQPVPEVTPEGLKMVMDGAEHVMLMPGMLTAAQMQQLDAARGSEFDRLFLTFMIQHHKGAVAMVATLFGTYGAGQDQLVFKFASDVNIDQTTEITRMEKMLAAVITSPH